MATTLLLNSSYEPLKVISWERAVTLLFLGKVEVIENYEKNIRSVSIVMRVPSVVRLLRYVKLGTRTPPLNKVNLLTRDDFSCQYCRRKLKRSDATIDHVVPRSQGGPTTWENVVVACPPCNRKKGGRTPLQAKMELKNKPLAPEWLPVVNLNIHPDLPRTWRFFFWEK
ncbi:MAG TPA: HNH endonuclease [Oligoflexia bacterium]|nr:HNH endonuclease [Oligoflexia bacterium]HMP47988.1 HNH endonuclease [Oligoflexia bacterium]